MRAKADAALKARLEKALNTCADVVRKWRTLEVGACDMDSRLYVHTLLEDISLVGQHLRPGSRLLDIGCGKGYVAAMLASIGLDVTAIDLEETVGEQLAITESRWQEDIWRCLERRFENVQYRYFDGRHIPAEAGLFDGVVAYAVIEHVAFDTARWLSEIRRVLKPGGLLFFFRCPRKNSLAERGARIMGLPHHEKLFSERELKELLVDNGFDILRFERTDQIPAFPPGRLVGLWNRLFFMLRPAERLLLKTPLSAAAHHIRVIAAVNDLSPDGKRR